MKQIGTPKQHVATMEASEQTGSTGILLDSLRPKKPHPLPQKLLDQSRVKTCSKGFKDGFHQSWSVIKSVADANVYTLAYQPTV